MSVQEGDIRKDAGGGQSPSPAPPHKVADDEPPVANQSGPADAETAQGSNVQPPSAATAAGGAANPASANPTSPNPTNTAPAPTGATDAAGSVLAADASAAGGAAGTPVEGDLEGLLARTEAERDEYLDLARRTQADFENFRKRAAQQAAEARTRAVADVVRELLPAIDNLERALAAIEDETNQENVRLGEGVRLVHDELHGILERLGLSALNPAGHPFDPNVHEAISTRPQDGTDAGVVLDVAQKGYLLGETVVRPARVVVSS